VDRLDKYRKAIESILLEYESIPYAYGDVKSEAVFDRKRDRYALLDVGWEGDERIRGCLVHIDIIDKKIWIHQDNTEDGIASELVGRGVPKEHIVLAFQSPERRQYSGYAVA
jgi:hypothetical protein